MKKSVAEVVAEMIAKMLDNGISPWHQPWANGNPRSINGHFYRGWNAILLGFNNYNDPRYLTFKRVKELGGMTSIQTRWTQTNKETRIQCNSAMVKEHILFKDESYYLKNREYREAMAQLCGYSMMGKNKHDDVCDALAMFVDWQMSDRANIVTILKRPF
jgi:antirestriction protein ArdC